MTNLWFFGGFFFFMGIFMFGFFLFTKVLKSCLLWTLTGYLSALLMGGGLLVSLIGIIGAMFV